MHRVVHHQDAPFRHPLRRVSRFAFEFSIDHVMRQEALDDDGVSDSVRFCFLFFWKFFIKGKLSFLAEG